jgi:hypothetical protein
MIITLDVKSVVVLEQKGLTDRIYITLNNSSPYPKWNGETLQPILQLETAQHYGKEYCEKVLGITVGEVISV